MRESVGQSRAPDDAWAAALLEELVATPSVSGAEAAAVELFVRRAREVGLEARIDEAGNAIATRRSSIPGAPEIVLLGHIDTVPGEIPVRVVSGVLHGRGAVDAKGPLAAFLVAAARLPGEPPATVHVVGAVGEETPDSPGARHIAETFAPDACLIGEPTGAEGYALGYKGRLLVEAMFEKAMAHSAGPGGSACDAAHAWWGAALRAVHVAAPQGASSGGGVFDSVQASIREMRSSGDGLRDTATLRAGFRLPLSLAPKELEALLRDVPGGPQQIGFAGHTPAFRAARDNPAAAALSGAIRSMGASPRPLVKTGTADMNIVGPRWGCPIAAYGPGDSALDHTPDERIEIAEFLRAIRTLESALPDLGARCAADRTASARA